MSGTKEIILCARCKGYGYTKTDSLKKEKCWVCQGKGRLVKFTELRVVIDFFHDDVHVLPRDND